MSRQPARRGSSNNNNNKSGGGRGRGASSSRQQQPSSASSSSSFSGGRGPAGRTGGRSGGAAGRSRGGAGGFAEFPDSRFADEDIDDDLAFDSDDEKEFGHFFAARENKAREEKMLKQLEKKENVAAAKFQAKQQNKTKKGSKMNNQNEDEELEDDYDDDDDDDESYESLSDLLDNDDDDDDFDEFTESDEEGDEKQPVKKQKQQQSLRQDQNHKQEEVEQEEEKEEEEEDLTATNAEAATTVTSKKKVKNGNNKHKMKSNIDLQMNESLFAQEQDKHIFHHQSNKTGGMLTTSFLPNTSSKQSVGADDLFAALSASSAGGQQQNNNNNNNNNEDEDENKQDETFTGLNLNKKQLAERLRRVQISEKKKSKKGDQEQEQGEDSSFPARGVLMPEASEEEQLRMNRRQTRIVIGQDMEKWKEFLKQQRKTRSHKFPLKAPDQDPTVSTLGGLANAVQHRQLEQQQEHEQQGKKQQQQQQGKEDAATATASSSLSAAQDLALYANELLGASGYGTTQAQKAVAKNNKIKKQQQEASGEFIEFSGEDPSEVQREKLEEQSEATREHVAKLKAVLGYEVQRRRRLNRIKSKTYRRILRVEKEKQAQKRLAAETLLNPERAKRRLQEKMEKQRAEERVLQRHKNTSKWIQHVQRAAPFDSSAKEAVQDQHRQHAVLMQKMQEPATEYSDDDENENNSNNNNNNNKNKKGFSDDAEDDNRVVDALLAGKGKSVLWDDVDDDENENNNAAAASSASSGNPHASAQQKLAEMSFMKKSKEKHRLENDKAADRFLNDLSLAQGNEQQQQQQSGGNQQQAVGRKKFSTAPVSVSALGDNTTLNNNNNDSLPVVINPGKKNNNSKKQSGTRRDRQDEQEQQQQEKSSLLNHENDDDENDYEREVQDLGHHQNNNNNRKKNSNNDSGAQNQQQNQQQSQQQKRELQDDRQDYLISRAFAQDELDIDAKVLNKEDNLQDEFSKKKSAQVDGIMKPEDPNASLPGWGEWGGTSEKLNQKHKKRVAENNLRRRMEKSTLMSARVDASLENVIINHDVDLVPSKHQLHMVPRPFANATEFTRSMRQPVGPEWTTPQAFKRQIAPKIVTRAGVAIEPLDNTTGLRKKTKTDMKKKDAGGGLAVKKRK